MAAVIEGAITIPPHIPANLVYDFHIFGDERYIADPYARVREIIRDAPPVFWSPRGNCWYVTGYHALVDAFKDTDVFSNVLRTDVPDDYVYSPYPLSVDPPRHKRYADPLKAVFSPATVAKLEGKIRQLAIELVEAIAPQGRCDFITAIAEPFPILIFLEILGVPKERFAEFRQVAIEYLNEPDMRIRFGKMMHADQLMSEFIEERRKQPQDDLISHLWTLEIGSEPINLVDMRRYAMMLFTAGLDSVTNGVGHSMHYFAAHPYVQTRLRDHPDEINAASEELLRRHGITTPPRRVARDAEFYGAPLRKDDFVELFVIAGNLNEDPFADPMGFKLKRSNTHLTFGFGIHRCIGAHLARIEMHTLYQEWLKRMPEVRLDPDQRVVFDPGHVLRIANLPLVWDVTQLPV